MRLTVIPCGVLASRLAPCSTLEPPCALCRCWTDWGSSRTRASCPRQAGSRPRARRMHPTARTTEDGCCARRGRRGGQTAHALVAQARPCSLKRSGRGGRGFQMGQQPLLRNLMIQFCVSLCPHPLRLTGVHTCFGGTYSKLLSVQLVSVCNAANKLSHRQLQTRIQQMPGEGEGMTVGYSSYFALATRDGCPLSNCASDQFL